MIEDMWVFGTACAQKYMAYALHTHKHKHTHRHATYTCMCVALTMPSFKRLLKGLLRSFLEKALKGAYFRRAASSTQETPWGAGVFFLYGGLNLNPEPEKLFLKKN